MIFAIVSSTYGCTVLLPPSQRSHDQPSAAGYHSHSSSANWHISTLMPRVPNLAMSFALSARKIPRPEPEKRAIPRKRKAPSLG
ncbi:MAG TPA: hypothetical protein DEW10_01165 [Bifidobacterium sp.]|nr:hypothetical protein [Bifidobacterium sp.]HAK72150.1 hypothetical protein [Bifidobacterium sp.]HCH21446.1 hypothetical protein [Bifidobacterium sp.]